MKIPESNLAKEYLERVKSGNVTPEEEKVLEVLAGIQETTGLGDVTITGVHNLGKTVIIVVKGDPGKMIGKNGKNIKAIEKETGLKVRVMKKMGIIEGIADLIYPARILSVGKVFSPEGVKRRIMIAKEDKRRMPIKKEDLEKAVELIYGEKVEVTFE